MKLTRIQVILEYPGSLTFQVFQKSWNHGKINEYMIQLHHNIIVSDYRLALAYFVQHGSAESITQPD